MATPPRRIQRAPLVADRVRSIGKQGFAFVPNRFLLDGFFAALELDELRLYLLLVLAADRKGMSFYGYDTLCGLLQVPLARYVRARNGLVDKDLIAFDGVRFQVLELPGGPPAPSPPLRSAEQLELEDPATVRLVAEQSLRSAAHQHPRSRVDAQLGGRDADEER
ncbi:MAG: hypothetical protein A2V88_13855 [Elusimicrobia bacterium RBG_16_66_12]|nr:MAG: hypothetical protein A2V88_13855 [Elusimicrobia bacterium RBG_16_66_12]